MVAVSTRSLRKLGPSLAIACLLLTQWLDWHLLVARMISKASCIYCVTFTKASYQWCSSSMITSTTSTWTNSWRRYLNSELKTRISATSKSKMLFQNRWSQHLHIYWVWSMKTNQTTTSSNYGSPLTKKMRNMFSKVNIKLRIRI